MQLRGCTFFGGVMPYNEGNREMFAKYKEHHNPDGEIRFLASNTDSKIKGVGTYQFYERRGFEWVGEKEIVLELSDVVDLKCLLYRKDCNSSVEQ